MTERRGIWRVGVPPALIPDIKKKRLSGAIKKPSKMKKDPLNVPYNVSHLAEQLGLLSNPNANKIITPYTQEQLNGLRRAYLGINHPKKSLNEFLSQKEQEVVKELSRKIPRMHSGGLVRSTKSYRLLKGEIVLSRGQRKGLTHGQIVKLIERHVRSKRRGGK